MSGNTLLKFRMLGFDIKLDTSWIFIAVLIVWILGNSYFGRILAGYAAYLPWLFAIIGAAGFFTSILLHELGHAVVARNYGIPVHGITLLMYGGVAELGHNPKTAKQDFMVAAAGPLVNFLLGFLFIGISGLAASFGLGTPILAVLKYLVFINFALAIFNLIPAFPLDGGRILRAALWQGTKNYGKATRWSAKVGMFFSLLLMAYGAWLLLQGRYIGGLWMFFIAIMMFNAAKQTAQMYRK